MQQGGDKSVCGTDDVGRRSYSCCLPREEDQIRTIALRASEAQIVCLRPVGSQPFCLQVY